ncbi:MAG: AsmA family protein [Candidatus Gastranaerophilales bacterium]|nr:AsmA family protein [Candidatus Gastranaerophilales bacterium]
MKKFLKIMGITLGSLVTILYLSFLFILPNAVDLNKFKPDLQKIVKEQANLNLDFDNAKISVTPLLSAGLKADNFRITLPDNSELLKADSFTGRISLPHLLLLTVRVSTAEVINPLINIDVVDGNAFKVIQAYEVILNNKEEKIEETLQTAEKPLIDPASIKIQVPSVKLINYAALVNDLKTGDFLKLRGDELSVAYNHGENVAIKTIAELFLNENKNISANIDIDTFLPALTELDEEDDKAQRVEIPFINPVAMYKAYDLKVNIDSKIKVRNKNNKIVSKGYLNVDNLTMNLAGMQLPESKFHLTSKGTKVNLDTDLFITNEEKLSILGMLNYGKKPATDIKITSNEIHLENVLNLIKATLNSLHIKHELDPIHGEGYFIADTYVKTDFKKLNSNGNIIIKDCIVKNIKNGLQIAKVNSTISLDDSMLKFIDTSVIVADTLFTVDGSINQQSVADISLAMEKMPLQKVFTMFLPAELNKTYTVNSGDINLTADIKGELKNAVATAKASLSNLSLTDKVNKISYVDNLLVADFSTDFKKFTGDINNTDFKLLMNGATVKCEKFNLNIGEKDIVISPAKITVNNSSSIELGGDIKQYAKKPVFNFDVNGNVVTADLKQLLGKDLEVFIKEKGSIPLVANINGDSKKQTLTASIEANANNYITPIDLANVLNKDTIIQTVVDFKGDRLKIKDTGFFIKSIEQDPNNAEKTITKLTEIVGVEGTITKLNTSNPNINLIKVKIPNDLVASIVAFPQSKLTANGNMFVFGDLVAPRVRGEFDIWDMSIPELMLTMDKATSKFESKDLDIEIKNLVANGSDFNILIDADLNPSQYFTIKNLNLMSNLTNADKLMEVSEAAMKIMPASTSTSTTSQPADIPVLIKDGNIDIKEIKTGAMTLNNTTSKLALIKNVIYLNNLITSAFQGKIKGDVSMNLVTSEIKANVKGDKLDVEQTLLEAAAMKDTLTGTMGFDANLSLRGATYEEQMKTLKGTVNFDMKDGSLGPFGKLENLIMAENIRESAFFQSTIGAVLNSLLSFDTTKYNSLTGHLTFDNGVTQINPIVSTGDVMGMYIFGDFDLLKNQIDIKLRGRLGSQVSDSLGPLALLNPVNLVKATPGMSIVLGKMFALFCEEVTADEIAQIPSLGKEISDNNATKFQVVVRGDVAKPLTLVKSFKWLALQSDIQNAQSHVSMLPENTVPEIDLSRLQNLDKEEIKTQVKEQAKKKVEEAINTNITEEDKQKIEQTKEAATKIKNALDNKEETKQQIKEQASKFKQNALQKLRQQALDALTVPTTEETTNTIE